MKAHNSCKKYTLEKVPEIWTMRVDNLQRTMEIDHLVPDETRPGERGVKRGMWGKVSPPSFVAEMGIRIVGFILVMGADGGTVCRNISAG